LAPRVTWTLPPGSSIAGPRWPTPRVFAGAGEVTYGYAGEVTLVFTFHVPKTATPGARLRLAARVEWLLCRESCVPGEGSVALDIAVARAAVPSVDREVLNRALARLPFISGPLTLTAREAGGKVMLTVLDPERHGRGKPNYFFPDNGELFTAPARQAWRPVPGGWQTELVKAPTWKRTAAPFTGVLVFPAAVDGRIHAWELAVRWTR
jgi:thiol:disulfide interchange protein DsbD